MGLFGLHLPKKVDNAFGAVGRAVQGAERQVNPFDNGVTYARTQSSGPVPASIASQANTNFVKPIIATAALAPKIGALAGNEIAYGINSDQTGQAAADLQNTYNHSMLGMVVSPFAHLGKGLYYVPQAIGREIQNKPITDIQQKAFGTTNQGDIAKSIIGNTVAAGLTVVAPEITGGLTEAASPYAAALLGADVTTPATEAALRASMGYGSKEITPVLSSKLAQGAMTTALRTGVAAPVGAAFGASNTVGANPAATKGEIAQGAKQGAALFSGTAAAGGLFGMGKDAVTGKVKVTSTPQTTIGADLQGEINRGAVGKDVTNVAVKDIQPGSDTLGITLDKKQVAQYVKDLKAGKPVEPLVVSHDAQGNTFVQDGAHRLEAAKQAGITNMPTVEKLTVEKPATPVETPPTKGVVKVATKLKPEDIKPGQITPIDKVMANSVGSTPEAMAAERINKGNKPSLYTKNALLNPTADELAMGKALGMSEKDVRAAKAESIKPDFQPRVAEAEAAALDHLKQGGLRSEAVKIYQDMAGVSEKTAKYNVTIAARDAKVPLNVLPETANPQLDTYGKAYKNPQNAEQIARNRFGVTQTIERAQKTALSFENKLSEADRNNMAHYIQGEKAINTAENPKLVQQAIDAWKNGADIVHAIGQNFGDTRHVGNFFPGYWNREASASMDALKAAQTVEETVGPDVWRKMTQAQKDDMISTEMGQQFQNFNSDANYGGFHNKSKIFASQAEGVAAKQTPMFTNPYDDMRRYFAGAKMQLGDQAVIQGARTAEPGFTGNTRTIDLATGKATVSPEMAKQLNKWRVGANDSNYISYGDIGNKIKSGDLSAFTDIGKKGWRGLNTTVIKTIVANPIFHGGNQEFNAAFRVAWDMPGNKVTNMVKLIKNQIATPEAVRAATADEYFAHGGISPTYGKDNYGFIANGLKKAFGENGAKVAEVSPTAMAKIEENIRTSLYKLGRDRGMTPEEAIHAVDRSLGSPEVLGDMSNSVGLFWHYFTTNVKSLGYVGAQGAKGNLAPVAGLAVGYSAYVAANKEWQKVTGNPNASLRAPGVIGTATQIAKAPGQIERGQVPSVITNHINPAISTITGLAANRDLHKPVGGHSAETNRIYGTGGEGVPKFLFNSLFGPGQTAGNVASDKTSLGEAGLNAGLGAYIPHAKGNPGAPNIPALNDKTVNVNGNKVVVKPAEGNDPTGYQQQQAYFKTSATMYKGLSQQDTQRLDGIIAGETDPNGAKIGGNDKQAMAKNAELVAHPDILNRIVKQKQDYAQATGTKLDPLYDKGLSDQQRQTYMRLQALPYKSDEWQHTYDANKSWLRPFGDARSKYFDSLPPNAAPPSQRVQPPSFNNNVNNMLDQADSLTGQAKGQYIADHPELQDAYGQMAKYTADRIAAQGGAPRDEFPVASPRVQQIIKMYNAVPKGGGSKGGNLYRAQWIKNNQNLYSEMTNFFTKAALYGLQKSAAQAQFQDKGLDSKALGDIYNIGNYDIAKGQNAQGQPIYALTTGASGGSVYKDQNGNTFADLGTGSGNPISGSKSSFGGFSKSGKISIGKIKSSGGNKSMGKAPKIRVSKGGKLANNGGKIKVSTTKLRLA